MFQTLNTRTNTDDVCGQHELFFAASKKETNESFCGRGEESNYVEVWKSKQSTSLVCLFLFLAPPLGARDKENKKLSTHPSSLLSYTTLFPPFLPRALSPSVRRRTLTLKRFRWWLLMRVIRLKFAKTCREKFHTHAIPFKYLLT